MHCPRCNVQPPRDPFVCVHCGERLLTYLDEPLGPGTGIRPEELGRGAEAQQQPSSHPEPARAGVAVHEERQRSWIERQIDPHPTDSHERAPESPGRPVTGDRRGAPRPGQPADLTGGLIWRIAFGILVAVCVMLAAPFSGLLMLGAVVLFLFRWPRAPFIAYASAMIAVAAGLWMVAEILDEADIPPLFPSPTPTPTIQRAFATPPRPALTPTRLPLTPAVAPTETMLLETDYRFHLRRARARWERGDTQAALASANKAVDLAPSRGEVLNMRALVRVTAGDLQGAESDAAAAVQADPSNANYRDTHGYTLLRLERWADAKAEYQKALATFRDAARGPSQIGFALTNIKLGQDLDRVGGYLDGGLSLMGDLSPDPQIADLEARANEALATLGYQRPGTTPIPSPAASPAGSPAVLPAATPAASPVASPLASPVALRADGSLPGRAP